MSATFFRTTGPSRVSSRGEGLPARTADDSGQEGGPVRWDGNSHAWEGRPAPRLSAVLDRLAKGLS